MEAVIMGGRNLMPGFGGALSRPKIQHLGGYVRRLGMAAEKPGRGGEVIRALRIAGAPAPAGERRVHRPPTRCRPTGAGSCATGSRPWRSGSACCR